MASIEWIAPAGIDDGTLDAVRRVESGGNPNAVSPAGAVGAYQFMPKTAAQFGIDPRDERQSRIAAGKYLSQLQDQFGGDRNLALLAYNWGPGNVDAWMRTGKGAKGQEMPPQAQQYADRVNRARDMAAAPQPSFMARMGDAAATAISGTAQAAESPRRSPTITWDDAPGASQPEPTSLRERSTLKINPTAAIGIDTTFDTGVPLSGGMNDKISRFGKGMLDVGQGLKQLWLMGTGKPGEAQDYTDQVKAENDRYEASRRLDSGGSPGTDWMRIGGNIAATAPAILIPGGNAATLGTRALSGGVGGALASASMFSDHATPAAKAGQAAIGGVLGAAAPVALSKMVDIGSGLLNKGNVVTTRAGQVLSGASSPAQVNLTIQQTLGSRGIDFSKLSAEAQAALSDDVRATLRAGAAVSADDIERKAAMLAFDMQPTAAQVTRDPKRWAFERNTADIEGAGDRLKARFVQQNQQLYGGAEKIKGATGGVSPDAHEASSTALSSLLKMDAAKKQEVGRLWDTAKASAGSGTDLPLQPIAQKLGELMEEAPSLIPSDIKSALAKYGLMGGKQTKVMTVQGGDDLIKQLNRFYNPMDPAKNRVIGELKSAIEASRDMLGDMGDVIGTDAAAAFRTARNASRSRAVQIENTPALKAALDGAAPDQFFGKFVLRGNASDLQALKQSLSSDPQAWNNLRGQTVEWLTDKATLGKGADGVFSGAQLRKAMATLGDQRMRVLFSPEEFANLKTLSKAASAATETPAFTKAGVGSNTAEKLSNLLSKGANLPYLRELVVKPLQSTARDIQVSSSLAGRTPAPSVPPLVSEDAKNALASRLGRSSVPLSVLVQGLAH